MLSANFEIKNYRCFSDEQPLRFSLNNGFVSFVGRNNSGKSSILKFFYEFREVWQVLSNENQTGAVITTHGFTINYLRGIDPIALFNVNNTREINITIELDDDMLEQDVGLTNCFHLRKVNIEIHRNNPKQIFVYFFDHNGNGIGMGKASFQNYEQRRLLGITANGAATFYTYKPLFRLFSVLSRSLYIGPFRNAINQGQGDYYDLKVGEAFITQWDSWKNGKIRQENLAIQRVITDIRNIFEYKSIDINASPDNKTLKINANDVPHEMDELGAGLAQFIIVLGNAAIKSPSLVLIDEPELHLHPSLQIDFITSLAKYADNGIIFSTHSLGLARSVSDFIYSCQLGPRYSSVNKLEGTHNYIEFLGEMGYSAYRDMGYDSILLVEGVHEVKTIQQFLRRFKKDHKIVIIPLGGDQLAKGGTEKELAEFRRLSDSVYALVDSEKTAEDSEPIQQRKDFKHICDKLGYTCLLTHRRAIENYFPDYAIKDEFGDKYSMLKPYQALRDSPFSWGKQFNWRIASRMNKDDLNGTDIGEFLASIK